MSHFTRNLAAFAKQRWFVAFGSLGMILTSSVTLAEPTAEKSFSVRVVPREDDAGNKIQATKQQVAHSIEGFRAPGEVETLVIAFMNPLEFPLVVEEERTVPAQ